MSASNTLPALGFAEEMTDEEREVLAKFGESVTVNDGDLLITEGHQQDSLYLIIFGTLHVQTGTTGRSVLLGSLKSGDTVGEVNIFDPSIASASVVAKSLAQAWRIDRGRLESYLEENPKPAARLLVNIATQLSHRLRKTNERVAIAREAMMDGF